MKNLFFFFALFSLALPTLCYAQLTVQKNNQKRTIDAKYIITIESKNLILHQPYKQKYNKRERYRGIPTFAFTDCKNIGVFADNLHILIEYYDEGASVRKDTMLIIPLADISAIVATKNEKLYGKGDGLGVIVFFLSSVICFTEGFVYSVVDSPEEGFPYLVGGVGFGLLSWAWFKNARNEKIYIISAKKWKLCPA